MSADEMIALMNDTELLMGGTTSGAAATVMRTGANRDADGTMTTARQWARARNISIAPTVLFLDRNGRNLANPLRGMQPDFYGAYLEQAIDEARAKIASKSAAAQ